MVKRMNASVFRVKYLHNPLDLYYLLETTEVTKANVSLECRLDFSCFVLE